ncbi:MAG TPA: RsiV family protein, partial [Blastocatellia bacterium]
LNVISDYSIRELNKLKTTAQVEIGAGPQIGNFHSWNITPFGLRITFDAYQVGPYAAGEHVVVIPYPLLKPIIRPDGLLTRFAK